MSIDSLPSHDAPYVGVFSGGVRTIDTIHTFRTNDDGSDLDGTNDTTHLKPKTTTAGYGDESPLCVTIATNRPSSVEEFRTSGIFSRDPRGEG